MGNRNSRRSRAKDKRSTLNKKKKVIIAVEGATEKKYFENFRISAGIDIVTCIDKPHQLVDRARRKVEELKRKKKFEATDEVWIVLDRDKVPNNPKCRQNFISILEDAESEDFKVAYSNDCFELWFILHFQNMTVAKPREKLDDALEQHLKSCDPKAFKDGYKHGMDIYRYIVESEAQAIKFATQLKKEKINQHIADADPSTNVFELVQLLRDEQ